MTIVRAHLSFCFQFKESGREREILKNDETIPYLNEINY